MADEIFDDVVRLPVKVYPGLVNCPNCGHRLNVKLEAVVPPGPSAVRPLKPKPPEDSPGGS